MQQSLVNRWGKSSEVRILLCLKHGMDKQGYLLSKSAPIRLSLLILERTPLSFHTLLAESCACFYKPRVWRSFAYTLDRKSVKYMHDLPGLVPPRLLPPFLPALCCFKNDADTKFYSGTGNRTQGYRDRTISFRVVKGGNVSRYIIPDTWMCGASHAVRPLLFSGFVLVSRK